MLRSNSADTTASNYGSGGSNASSSSSKLPKMGFSTPMNQQVTGLYGQRKSYDEYSTPNTQGTYTTQQVSSNYQGSANWSRHGAPYSAAGGSGSNLSPQMSTISSSPLDTTTYPQGYGSSEKDRRLGWGNTPTFATQDPFSREQPQQQYQGGQPRFTEDVSQVKNELKMKDSIIESLQTEIEVLRAMIDTSQSRKASVAASGHNDPGSRISELEQKLEDTEGRLEAVLTAIALNPNPGAATKTGRYDEQEMAHKIFTKLRILHEENEEMAKMLSYGRVKHKEMQIGMLKAENEKLKEKLKTYEDKSPAC